jgi:arsenate reductase
VAFRCEVYQPTKVKVATHETALQHPKQTVTISVTLQVLTDQGYGVTGLRSKSWNEFAALGAPSMDFIFTVCDRAAGECCPTWPGHPITAHWGFADSAAVTGDRDKQLIKAFITAQFEIASRIRLLINLLVEKIERLSL